MSVIGVSKEIEQIKIVENIIKKTINNKNPFKKILIIPSDHSLLIPLIYSIRNVFNIQSSIHIHFPLKDIPLHYTFQVIFEFLIQQNKFNKIETKYVKKIFLDRYIQNIFIKNNFIIKKLLHNNNSYFISKQLIEKYLMNNYLHVLFIKSLNIKKILKILISFIRKIKNFLYKDITKHYIELQFLYKLELLFFRLKILDRKKIISSFIVNDLFHIYNDFVKMESMEYRNKKSPKLFFTSFTKNFIEKFDITIITSFNENVIPPKKKNYSLIPYDIQKKLRIHDDLMREKYYFSHFIRIYQSSKKIFLIFKNQPDEINSGEMSSFIHQLKIGYKISIKNKNFSCFPNKKKKPIFIEKTKYFINQLNDLRIQGISPSSIILYNKNPILFYSKKILNLKNKESNLCQLKIGEMTHKVLQLIYSPIKGNYITNTYIHHMKKIVKPTIKKILSEQKLEKIKNNRLYYFLIKNYIEHFILWDEQVIQKGNKILIKNVEHKISNIIHIQSKKIHLHGIIDRIDEINGVNRIIDYKIGLSKKKDINISFQQRKDIFTNPIYSNTMQLLIYVYLWFNSHINNQKSISKIEIISPIKYRNNVIIKPIPINFFCEKKTFITYKEYKTNFFPFLSNRINEILNPKIPIIEKIY
ncbi:PD-(D/E)XK nuclease family protein [Blattabacterium cuenoti]|uniref:PD-(D/E)XK nuclease family protein n=1 Tax=Blattabacterium cuenoti TaxID=1653831 RepID=UPI00163C6DE7|nr:PD-(D/E)XK nuclease family protein [Blattabacterium cuenoti]